MTVFLKKEVNPTPYTEALSLGRPHCEEIARVN